MRLEEPVASDLSSDTTPNALAITAQQSFSSSVLKLAGRQGATFNLLNWLRYNFTLAYVREAQLGYTRGEIKQAWE